MVKIKEQKYNQQEGKCFYCGKYFSLTTAQFSHIVPSSLNSAHSLGNLVISCNECNKAASYFNEFTFTHFIKLLLEKNIEFRNIKTEFLVSSDLKYRADILVEQFIDEDWKKVWIEMKSFPTFTSQRIEEILNQLKDYKENVEDVKFVLAFPGVLPAIDNEKFKNLGIEIWDKNFIQQKFIKEINESENTLFQLYFSRLTTSIEDELLNKLASIPAGKEHWRMYQKHIGEILSYLFGDILSDPIIESSDQYGINRRDFILRNYCESSFWKYLRERYLADFIVIDAKNYSGPLKKDQVLQIANYLKAHGAGLFAIIISRNGEEDEGAFYTRKEKWLTENKMIVILDDSDIEKMILAKAASNFPEEIIKQRIESFRLEM